MIQRLRKKYLDGLTTREYLMDLINLQRGFYSGMVKVDGGFLLTLRYGGLDEYNHPIDCKNTIFLPLDGVKGLREGLYHLLQTIDLALTDGIER